MRDCQEIRGEDQDGGNERGERCGEAEDHGDHFIQQHVKLLHEHEFAEERKSPASGGHRYQPQQEQMIRHA